MHKNTVYIGQVEGAELFLDPHKAASNSYHFHSSKQRDES